MPVPFRRQAGERSVQSVASKKSTFEDLNQRGGGGGERVQERGKRGTFPKLGKSSFRAFRPPFRMGENAPPSENEKLLMKLTL